ncbi:MAG: hypothetical protein ACRESV_02915, partial [Nevskiales bacterium]
MSRLAHKLRSLLIVFLAAAGLSAAGTFLYLQYSLRSTIEQHVSERLGTETHVGLAHIGLFPRGIRLVSISIRNPDGFHDKHFVQTRALKLEIENYDRKSRLIRSPLMTIDDMQVWIEHQGRHSNSGIIKDNLARFEHRRDVSPADKTKLIIRELRIRNIEAHLRAGSDNTTAEIPELVLRNVGNNRGGVTIGELADIVTQAALRAVVKNEIRREFD